MTVRGAAMVSEHIRASDISETLIITMISIPKSESRHEIAQLQYPQAIQCLEDSLYEDPLSTLSMLRA